MKHLLAFLCVLAAGRARAQAPDPDTTARHFLIMASIGNLHETNDGKLAADKAVRPDVKAFGTTMANEHGQSQQLLLQLARTNRIELPANAVDIPVFDPKLQAASGEDFDRMYIHAMVPAHQMTVERFERYALNGKNPEVRAFAQRELPMLRRHLAEIEALDEKYRDLSAR